MNVSMPRFDQGRVLVIGDLMLDRYWHGDTSRISPEAPVPVVKVGSQEDRPGGAANVALNVRALGAPASLIGLVGADDAGRALEKQLSSAGIYCDFAVTEDEPTVTKLRVLSRHQQLIRLDFEEAFHRDHSQAIAQRMSNLINHTDVVIISDYAKGTLSSVEQLINTARNAGKVVLVDPKGTDFQRYAGATLLTPNLSEFEAVVGHCSCERELVKRGQALIEKLQLEALLVTRSEQGMTLIRPGLEEIHYPARAREVYDVTGAGDTVISTLAAALASGETMATSVALANIAAGIVVAKLGTAAISAPELRRKVMAEQGAEQGVVAEDQLMIALEEARTEGESIVFTNGCFDILHAGHVGYLEEARSKGDRLVLAVNSDDSVRRLKGDGRPINPVERRMAVLAGLAAVDWVIPFDEDTPERIIRAVKPDVLVKGGDYTVETVVGAEFVQSYGGRVELMPFLDACSTTLIVDKIKADAEQG
ncbi:bifunctional D-glycero-beta-D-manno-heptose-7-phosphate kinase/D-glycero-beta-D-manno-heptose 1-phosphate adenylyltransferase HldE [Pontibacterium sp.]|uniref:bifunctional D-glycero-beta-D-manno-heptose-7-phosphate kinase/D-glycero-beta-D-manno-heptose 1-phosphate adenylyltransferase HldE n=1 Tax=Pontibacterium sp. TaxID=2036026 RepID=UPI0035137362